ncbi:hypothetical protein DV738_g542, partial [Chaetothyriales sp. CBS 135597]
MQRLLVLGCVVSVLAAPEYGCVYSPSKRQCWRDGFDINTDYEVHVPLGKLVEYELTISNAVIAPDGYLANATLINGQYPGPTLEADWGDTLRITVHNNLTNNNGTADHWQGIHQFQTNYLDGVPGVTQCPSKPGESQVLQYTNGANGALQFHGPSSANFDKDLGPWLISDWYYTDAFTLYPIDILPHPRDQCAERQRVVFEKGKTYRIGLVNTGSLLTYKLWVDGHNFTVIQNDFVPIKPFETDVLAIGIDFWFTQTKSSTNDPYTPPASEQHYGFGCHDLPPSNLVPIVKQQAGDIVPNLDNPGAWLLHCHIAWQVSAGLVLQFIEQPMRDELEQRRGAWSDCYTNVNEKDGIHLQANSGV